MLSGDAPLPKAVQVAVNISWLILSCNCWILWNVSESWSEAWYYLASDLIVTSSIICWVLSVKYVNWVPIDILFTNKIILELFVLCKDVSIEISPQKERAHFICIFPVFWNWKRCLRADLDFENRDSHYCSLLENCSTITPTTSKNSKRKGLILYPILSKSLPHRY